MVSVIIPIYNVEAYLPRCLDCLSKQGLDDKIEVILVDDGATDSSIETCEEYCAYHPGTILLHQENKGLSEARNAGIKAASGEWIFFLDADDWLAPNALSTLLSYAETHSCDMVVGSFYYAYDSYLLYDDRWFKSQDAFVLTTEEAMLALIKQQYFKNFAWGKLYRTQYVKKHLFRPGVYFEDAYWQHQIVDDSDTIGVVPKPLYYYRQRKDGISGVFSHRNLDLLKGYEDRLVFIHHKYPQLMDSMTKKYWKLCRDFSIMARRNNPQLSAVFDHYYQQAFLEHNDAFEKSMKNYLPFQITQRAPFLYPVYMFFGKVLTRLFCKKPTRIPI